MLQDRELRICDTEHDSVDQVMSERDGERRIGTVRKEGEPNVIADDVLIWPKGEL